MIKKAFGDGLGELVMKAGDKELSSNLTSFSRMNTKTLDRLYASNWIIRKFVNKHSEDMTKIWRVFTPTESVTELDNGILEVVAMQEKRFHYQEIVTQCLKFASLHGSCLLVALTTPEDPELVEADEMKRLATHLNLNLEQLDKFLIVKYCDYEVEARTGNIFSKTFGKPSLFSIKVNGTKILVDKTRAFELEVNTLPNYSLSNKRKGKYGISDIQAVYEPIDQYLQTAKMKPAILSESILDIFYLNGLQDRLADGEENSILEYFSLMKTAKQLFGGIAIDKESEYEQKQLSLSGLSDIGTQQIDDLCGALDMPRSVLWGEHAGGLNNGSENLQPYYDKINSMQENRLRGLLDFMDKLAFRPLAGYQQSDWSYVFPTIRIPSKKEKYEMLTLFSTAVVPLLQEGVLSDAQVKQELFNDGLMTSVTEDDIHNDSESVNADYYLSSSEDD